MTPDDYERQAAEAEARAADLKDDAKKILAIAEMSLEQARWLRQQAAKLRRIEGGQGLPRKQKRGTVNSKQMPSVAISRGRSALPEKPKTRRDRVIAALNAAGHSLRSAADEIDVSVSGLSLYLKGERPLNDEAKAKLEKLTGLSL